jgi:hypothetical protein
MPHHDAGSRDGQDQRQVGSPHSKGAFYRGATVYHGNGNYCGKHSVYETLKAPTLSERQARKATRTHPEHGGEENGECDQNIRRCCTDHSKPTLQKLLAFPRK